MIARGRRIAGRLLLASLSALLLGIYARFPGLAFLPYFTLVPWVILYTDEVRPRVSAFYYVVTAYAAWLLLHPIFFNFGWMPPLLMGAIFFVAWVPFAPLLQRIHHGHRLPRTLTVPVVWVAVEWLRVTLTLAHFDIYLLGYSQARFPALIQIADIAGVYGVSFLVAAVNGFIADVLIALKQTRWSARPLLRDRRLVTCAVSVALAFTLVLGYGFVRLSQARYARGPQLAILQPNLVHSSRHVVSVHLAQVLMTEHGVPPGKVDLIVWPENAILDDLYRKDDYLEDLKWLADRKDAWMLVGALAKRPEHPGKTTNSAFLVSRAGVAARYDKQILFPWSEYIPLDGFLARVSPTLQRLHRTVARQGWGTLALGVPGEGMHLLHLPWNGSEVPFATLICGENIHPPVAAEANRLGARFLVHITSEGLVGGPSQEQALRISILRAVENRLPYVRACNTGISCFIDPAGRPRSVLVGQRGRITDDRGGLVGRLLLSSGEATAYVRSRDAFGKMCAAATVALWAWSWLPRRRPADAMPSVRRRR